MTMRPAWGRIGLGLLGLIVLAVLIYMGPASAPGKSDWALRMLATALSILAGILLAVITLLGDPGGLYLGNWRVASAHRRDIQRTLNRFMLLFWVYLLVIALALVTAIFEAYEPTAGTETWVRWVKHIALSGGCVALLWSFSLPVTIRNAQLGRLDREVEGRRREASAGSEPVDLGAVES